jgi:hypothetical protein
VDLPKRYLVVEAPGEPVQLHPSGLTAQPGQREHPGSGDTALHRRALDERTQHAYGFRFRREQ